MHCMFEPGSHALFERVTCGSLVVVRSSIGSDSEFVLIDFEVHHADC